MELYHCMSCGKAMKPTNAFTCNTCMDEGKSQATNTQSPGRSALNACSATAMRELKTEIIEMIRSTELNDDQELCLESQELIVGWIDVFIENKIFDEGLK